MATMEASRVLASTCYVSDRGESLHKLTSIEALAPDPDNPREITEAAAQGLRYSLDEFGDLSGITWNARTGQLVCGHQRVRELRGMGAVFDEGAKVLVHNGERFSIRIVDWPHSKQRAANIAANNDAIAGQYTADITEQIEKMRSEMDPALFEALQFESIQPPFVYVPPPMDDSEDGAKEVSEDDIGGQEHECPRCGFQF